MAQTAKRATELSSPVHPSPSDILGDTRIPRRLVKISSDQRDLLARNDSWATYLRRRTNGFLNVPPEVLQNLKECHARQLQPTQSDDSPPSTEPQDDAAAEIEQRGSQPPEVVRLELEAESDDDDENEAPPSPSWTPSPVAHHYPPQRLNSPGSEGDEGDKQQFITQLPPISSPRPTAPVSVQRQPVPTFPPSSEEQDEPLEVEVPTAINDGKPPVNKSSVPAYATPPSAQIVPCTLEQAEQSSIPPKGNSKPNPKQRIYKAVPEFYRPSKSDLNSIYLPVSGTRSRQLDAPFTRPQSSTSSSFNTSSSIIPSTIPNEGISKGLPPSPSKQTLSLSKGTPIRQEGLNSLNTPDYSLAQRHSPEYKPQSPRLASSPPLLPVSAISIPAKHQPITGSHSPFVLYAMTYPTYLGHIGDFVTACMYIQLQQRRIRTSLYDDFIRAWQEGYVSYVRDCDDSSPPVKALNAIDWYNEIDDDPLYTSRVVTRQNIKSILDFYPEELRLARSHLGLSPNPTPTSTSTPPATPAKKKLDSGPTKYAAPVHIDLTGSPDIAESDIPEVDSRIIPQVAEPPLPQREANNVIPVHTSMSEIERRPATAKALPRSLSETIPHKRKPSEELNGPQPKRFSVNSLLRSDSGSVPSVNSEASRNIKEASVAPSSTAEKRKKFANDPMKRSKAFAKFLKKRKQWEKDSIASSTPMNNTPTSAQRG
ncbi:hypothetical protein GGR54DRAFT_615310 [Hypoxylon sp. NC1633]|nr:hypothetical protein GGR54DRAFT_615310 [Hypoxylon sp. NC1633]